MEIPSVRQLECLVAVARTLNFREAAESCYITQPALSAQIQLLEAKLGVRLFERDRRKVLPTAAGETLAEKARGILAELHDLTEAATGFRDPLTGTIKLGVIPTAAPYVLPRALGEVGRRYPDLRLRLREEQTAKLLERLGDGSLDVALVALEAGLGDVETLALFTDPFVLAVPSGHRLANRKRVSEKDLHAEEVLLLDDGHCLRDQALSICGSAGACELWDFRASSLTTLVQMVSGGLGVTLLPEMSLEVEAGPERQLSLIPFGPKGPSRTIGLAWRRSSIRKAEFELIGAAIRSGGTNPGPGHPRQRGS
jgi:LysR family hydrogen peroxide-inducible transcriptional activator